MTDINGQVALRSRGAGDRRGDAPDPAGDICPARLIAYVELLFFAYRDFTGEADTVLSEFGFGRAHHRVLHFVHRRPGLRVADLLDILRITKQSLARVLRQLVEEGFIEQRPGEADRRERLLFATPKGSALAEKLVALQISRIAAALAEAGPDAPDVTQRFLAGMIGQADRASVEALVAGRGPATPTETDAP